MLQKVLGETAVVAAVVVAVPGSSLEEGLRPGPEVVLGEEWWVSWRVGEPRSGNCASVSFQ